MNLLRPLRDLRLGIKLNINLLLIFGILLMAILFIMRNGFQDLILQIGQQRALQEAQIVQERFIELEKKLLGNAKVLAGRPGLVETVAGKKDVDNLRIAILVGGASLELDDISVVDETGNHLIDIDRESGSDEAALFSLGLLGIDTIGVVSDEVDEEGNPEFHQAAVVPLRGTAGLLVGSLLAEQKVDDEFLGQINFSREDVELVLVHEGEVLAKTRDGQVDPLDQAAISQAMTGQTIVTNDTVNIGGISYIIAYMPLIVGDNVEGVMAVLLNIDSLVMFQNRLVRNTSLVFYGLGFAAVILLTLFVGRTILVPVNQLYNAVQQMTRGDYESQVKVTSKDEVGRLAQAFNDMAEDVQTRDRELRELATELQQRTQALETITEISRRLTTILDIDQLLQEVVANIQNTFGYYHVHIYIINQTTGDLVMREGTGEVGRRLKAKGHRLKAGQGIVGKVARSGEAFFAENVDEVPDFVRNPLLPKTQAELAVPIRKGDTILGVLDMQSEEVGSFSEEDLNLMQSIADQVAVVLENTRLFRQAQAAAVEAERLTHRLTRESWQDMTSRVSTTGYVFTKSGVTPVSVSDSQTEDEAWLPIMAESVQERKLTYHAGESDNNGQQVNCLSIPLVLRNEVIGVIGIERAVADTAPDISGEEAQKNSRAWSEDELATIQAIAEQVALALDAARLALETERAAWRDRVVGESIARVWASDEIEEVMKAAVTQLGDKLRASEVVIRLVSEDDLLLE
jgi:GAF domain-containing protein/HAMP domain-containing protein